jgi:hypothetical protein
MAKQLDHLGQSNGLEGADSEMKPPAYKSVEVRHLTAATPLAWLAGEHLPISMAALSVGNASSAKLLLLLLLLPLLLLLLLLLLIIIIIIIIIM